MFGFEFYCLKLLKKNIIQRKTWSEEFTDKAVLKDECIKLQMQGHTNAWMSKCKDEQIDIQLHYKKYKMGL